LDQKLDLDAAQILSIRDGAIEQLKFAREYLRSLLEHVEAADWFRIPDGFVSHVAWQVGHITVAQYGLLLFRQRGRAENDTELMPGPFRKRFGKGTVPSEITPQMYSPEHILQVLQDVYEESMKVLPTLTAEKLWEPEDIPYAGYPRKLGSILLAPMHEMVHAGQIGSLRRALGLDPVR
jgi:hypothetical protein